MHAEKQISISVYQPKQTQSSNIPDKENISVEFGISKNCFKQQKFFRDIFYIYHVCSLPGVLVSEISSMLALSLGEPHFFRSLHIPLIHDTTVLDTG